MIDIRAGVVPDDVEPCARLWVRALANRDGAVEAEAVATRVRSAFESPIVRFAIAVSIPTTSRPLDGFALTEAGGGGPGEALLHFLAVDPRSSERGIGTRLLADAVRYATAGGFESLVLDVRTNNARAIGMYEQAGFVPDGSERPHPLGGPPMQPYRLKLTSAPRTSSA